MCFDRSRQREKIRELVVLKRAGLALAAPTCSLSLHPSPFSRAGEVNPLAKVAQRLGRYGTVELER